MTYNLAIDADSILYTNCYRHQDIDMIHWFPELAYKDFCSQISGIESALYKQYDLQKEDKIETEIIFSPKKTFRNELSELYKASRKPTLIVGIAELKQMVSIRLGMTQIENLEADDIVITRAYEKENVIIACIDKDIFTHSPVPCFNYKKWSWTEAMEQEAIELEYMYQAIMGDSTDGVVGIKGKGKVFAQDFVYGIDTPTLEDWANLYSSREEAILQMRLVRMDMYKKGELILWEI